MLVPEVNGPGFYGDYMLVSYDRSIVSLSTLQELIFWTMERLTLDLWLAKDNRFLNPKSSYERILTAPPCRLTLRQNPRALFTIRRTMVETFLSDSADRFLHWWRAIHSWLWVLSCWWIAVTSSPSAPTRLDFPWLGADIAFISWRLEGRPR